MSDDDQGSLFDDEPDMNEWTPERVTRYEKVRRQWWEFHQANDAVYGSLRQISLDLRRRGRERYGISGVFEVMRWHRAMSTTDQDYKINNNYKPFYARLLMRQEPELVGFFELREQTSQRS